MFCGLTEMFQTAPEKELLYVIFFTETPNETSKA
jgi:hypothetical protein